MSEASERSDPPASGQQDQSLVASAAETVGSPSAEDVVVAGQAERVADAGEDAPGQAEGQVAQRGEPDELPRAADGSGDVGTAVAEAGDEGAAGGSGNTNNKDTPMADVAADAAGNSEDDVADAGDGDDAEAKATGSGSGDDQDDDGDADDSRAAGKETASSTKSSSKAMAKAARAFFDDIADESDGEGGKVGRGGGKNADDDDDDGGDGANEYQTGDGFVVEDADDDAGRKRRRFGELDDEDYELIGQRRPAERSFKRLRLKRQKTQEIREFDDEVGLQEENLAAPQAETTEQLEREMFGDAAGDATAGAEPDAAAGDISAGTAAAASRKDPDTGAERSAQPFIAGDIDGEYHSDSQGSDDLDDFIVRTRDEEQDQARRRQERRARQEELRQEADRTGLSRSQLAEAYEMFGDEAAMMEEVEREADWMDEDEAATKVRHDDEASFVKKTIEPSELRRRYLATDQEKIRDTDAPERLQELFGARPEPGPGEIAREAQWIFEEAFESRSGYSSDRYVSRIAAVLSLLRTKLLEVPFIEMYRKEQYQPELQDADLWLIHDCDVKWNQLAQRKTRLRRAYTTINARAHISDAEEIPDTLLDLLDQSRRLEEVEDLFNHAQVHFGRADLIGDASGAGGAVTKGVAGSRRTLRMMAKDAGLNRLKAAMSISAADFANNLVADMQVHEPSNPDTRPEIEAFNYLCSAFKSEDDVLTATRSLLAQDIASDPQFRVTVRSAFESKFVVTTRPLPKQRRVLDAFHPFGPVSRIHAKPVTQFSDDQFLLMTRAEEEGYITIDLSINLESPEATNFMKELTELLLSDQTSDLAEVWNEQRRMVLDEVFSKHTFPMLRDECRSRLLQRAQEFAAARTAAQLTEQLLAGPFQPPSFGGQQHVEDEHEDPHQMRRVLAVMYGMIPVPTMAAMIDGHGRMTDFIKLDYMSLNRNSAAEVDQVRREANMTDLRRFILRHRPHVIAIGADSLDARRCYGDITGLLADMEVDPPIHVAYASTQAAAVFARSTSGEAEFPEHPQRLREAVGLGRFVQDPLTMLAGLFNYDDDILALPLYHLQDAVPKDLLLKLLSRCFQQVVAKVGVQPHRFIANRSLAGVLQFVPGLGPIKADALLRAIGTLGIVSRKHLRSLLRSKVVETNCIAYFKIIPDIRIDDEHELTDDLTWRALDMTRVHPDSYHYAIKMVNDALDKDDDDDPDEVNARVTTILDYPSEAAKLDYLNLEAFSDALQKLSKLNVLPTLRDIRLELQNAFADPRYRYRDPTPSELFWWMTGETERSFREGMLVTVTVTGLVSAGVRVRFDNGLTGFIHVSKLSDERVDHPEDKVRVGQVIQARIERVRNDGLPFQFGADLACSSRVLADPGPDRMNIRDPYYIEDDGADDDDDAHAGAKKYTRRAVMHPNFRNMGRQQAEQYLADKEIGTVLIRPSSLGPDKLNITWKFGENAFVNILVAEEEKASDMTLGKRLVIGNEVYEDLDEILARYVEPMIMYARNAMSWRKFVRGGADAAHRELRKQKEAHPRIMPYLLGVDSRKPGVFLLYYYPSTRPRSERVTLTPDGYRFRRTLFSSVEELARWFKTNYKHASLPSQSPAPPPHASPMNQPPMPPLPQQPGYGYPASPAPMPPMYQNAPHPPPPGPLPPPPVAGGYGDYETSGYQQQHPPAPPQSYPPLEPQGSSSWPPR